MIVSRGWVSALLLAAPWPVAAAPATPDDLSAAPTSAAPAPSASASLDEAARAIAGGRMTQARAMLAAAVAAGASGPAVDRLLADLALARGEDALALAHYKAVLRAYPDEALLLERAGRAALRLGQTDEATALLDRATARDDASAAAWALRGVAADRRGAWDEADAAYRRAMTLAPADAAIATNRGWSLLLQGRWDEARAMLERAAALPGAPARARRNLDLAREALDADLPARRAGEASDDYAARLNDAGVAAQARGETARARAAFAQAIEQRGRYYQRAAGNLAALEGEGK